MKKSISPRRTLILLPGVGGIALLLDGCGGGGDSTAVSATPTPPSPPVSATCSAFEFSANHGHALSIPLADLDSTTVKTYDVQAGAPHSHRVILSAAQLAQLKAGQSIAFTTELGGPIPHFHDVTGRCA